MTGSIGGQSVIRVTSGNMALSQKAELDFGLLWGCPLISPSADVRGALENGPDSTKASLSTILLSLRPCCLRSRPSFSAIAMESHPSFKAQLKTSRALRSLFWPALPWAISASEHTLSCCTPSHSLPGPVPTLQLPEEQARAVRPGQPEQGLPRTLTN